ncbi:MAG: hypothetical protein RIT27_1001 [Pseudomonadota bacterium]|jgi:hypothetical protein
MSQKVDNRRGGEDKINPRNENNRRIWQIITRLY